MLPYFHELVSLFFRGKTTQFVPIYLDHPDYVEQFDQADQADHPDQMTALINHKRRSSAMNIAPDINNHMKSIDLFFINNHLVQ